MTETNSLFATYIQSAIEYLSQITHTIVLYFSQPTTYLHLTLVLLIVGCGFILRRHLKKKFVRKEKNKSKAIRAVRRILQHLINLSAPIIAFLLLLVAVKISRAYSDQSLTLEIASRLSIIWALWAAIRTFIENPFIRTLGVWVLVPAAFLSVFGELKDVISILDSASLAFGKIEITAFTILKAIVFFSFIFWFGKFLSQVASEYIRRKNHLNISTKELLIKGFDIVLYIILFIVSLDLIGIDLTALTVFSGALGVGLGFGLQKIASNFISGIILLSERSVTLGNLIEMDNGVFGYMRKLGARASVIETFDGKEVMVPNEDFITSRVANLTYSSNLGRIEIPVGVAYGSDIKKAQTAILEAAEECEKVSTAEGYTPECLLRTFNDSSVDFLLIFWIDDVQKGRWRAQSDVMFAVWDKLQDNKIDIPFPQRDLHIRSSSIDPKCSCSKNTTQQEDATPEGPQPSTKEASAKQTEETMAD